MSTVKDGKRGGVRGSSNCLSCCQLCSLPLVELPTVDLDKPKLVTKPVKELRVLDPKSAQNICKCVTYVVCLALSQRVTPPCVGERPTQRYIKDFFSKG